MSRQRMMLYLLLVVLAVALVRAYLKLPKQQTVAELTYRPGSAKAAGPSVQAPGIPNQVKTDTCLRLDLLDAERSSVAEVKRNLFTASIHSQVPPLHSPETVNKIRQALWPEQQNVPPTPPPPTPAEIMQRTLSAYTFLGVTTINGNKTAFFSKGAEIVSVKAGSRLAGRYEAAGISDEVLTVRIPETGEQIAVPLFDKQKPVVLRRLNRS
jgi:hypothetical protein